MPTKAADRYESLFTKAILNAFTKPPDWLLSPVDDRQVITNRKLWIYLEEEMVRLSDENELIENIAPFIEVPSRDEVYIAGPHPLEVLTESALATKYGLDIQDTEFPETDANWLQTDPSPHQLYAEAFVEQDLPVTATKGIRRTAKFEANLQESLFELRAQKSMFMPLYDLLIDQVPDGIAVYGADVLNIATTAEVSSMGPVPGLTSDGAPGEARFFAVDGSKVGETAVLSFDNGTGCVLALLSGYIAHVFVGDTGASMIAYEPTPHSEARSEFEFTGDRRSDLRALITLALRDGVFGVDDSFTRAAGSGETFADQVRSLKHSDPTLGIYAAYGYAQAGVQSEVREILDIQSDQNQLAPIYDNVLLARDNVVEGSEILFNAVPFCPMLRNGWSYLPVKGVAVPKPVSEALQYLTPSVWTSFTEPGIEILQDALWSGRL